MGLINSDQSYSGLVEKYIGTAYDNVKIVADNIDAVISIGSIEDIPNLENLMNEAITTTNANRIACAASEISAGNSETAAAASQVQVASDAADVAAAVVDVDAAVTTTNANVVLTNADVVTTDANRQQTQIDVAQTQADVVTTAENASATQADVISSGQNATDADGAATDAEAALYTFVGQYLGAHAVSPTVDGNGETLTVGDLYQDTSVTPNLMKFWNGTNWLVAYSTIEETNHSGLIGLGADDHQIYILATGARDFTGAVKVPVGDATTPGYTFTGDINTGFFRKSADVIGVTCNGVEVGSFSSAGLTIPGDIAVVGTVDGVDISTIGGDIDAKEDALGNPSTGADCLVSATNGTRAWETRVKPSEMSNALALKEGVLGNPDVDGKVLTSTAAGARSWIPSYSKWTELDDTPNSMSGQAGKVPSVSGSEDTFTFVDLITANAVGVTPPANPAEGTPWFNSDNGQLYTWYTSPINGAQQWVKDNENFV